MFHPVAEWIPFNKELSDQGSESAHLTCVPATTVFASTLLLPGHLGLGRYFLASSTALESPASLKHRFRKPYSNRTHDCKDSGNSRINTAKQEKRPNPTRHHNPRPTLHVYVVLFRPAVSQPTNHACGRKQNMAVSRKLIIPPGRDIFVSIMIIKRHNVLVG